MSGEREMQRDSLHLAMPPHPDPLRHPGGTRGALKGLPLLYRLQRERVVFLTLRHGRGKYGKVMQGGDLYLGGS